MPGHFGFLVWMVHPPGCPCRVLSERHLRKSQRFLPGGCLAFLASHDQKDSLEGVILRINTELCDHQSVIMG